MPRTTTEFQSLPFDCPLVERRVSIDREYRVLWGRDGSMHARFPATTDCSDQDNCPIATHHGNGTSYNWSICAFKKAEDSAR